MRQFWPLQLAILVLCTFVGFWNLLILSPIQPFLAADLGISTAQAGYLTAVSAASALVSLVAFGLWGSRISRKLILVIGLTYLALGSQLMVVTDNYEALLVFRVFNGIADGLIYPAACVAIFDYLPKEKRSLGIQAIVAGTGLSAVVGLPLTALLVEDGNWHRSIEVFTYVSLGVLALVWLLPKPTRPQLEQAMGGFKALVQNRRLRTMSLANVFGDMSWFGALTFLGSFLVKEYQPSLRELSLFFLVAGISFVIGSSVVRQPDFRTQRRYSILSSLVVVPMAVLFFMVTESLLVTTVIAGFYALVRAPGIVGMDTMLLEEAEDSITQVTAGAVTNIITALGTLGGALLGSLVLSNTAYTTLGGVLGISSLIAFLFLLPLRDRHQPVRTEASPALA